MTNDPPSLAEGATAAAVPCERCGGFTLEHELAVVGTQRLCQACQVLRRAEIAIHPYRRLLLFGVLTSPAVALWLLADSARRLGEPGEARGLRVAAIVVLVVTLAASLVDDVPRLAVFALQLGALLFGLGRWKDRLDRHLLHGGARVPLLPTPLGVIGAVALVLVGLSVLVTLFLPDAS